MKTASVSELKARLAHFLRMARRGTEVQILERGVPIARLAGLHGTQGDDEVEARLERLAQAGILRRGTGDLSWLLDEAPVTAAGAELAVALDEDREDRL